jgi:periplasmic divalent cation tolerance protein
MSEFVLAFSTAASPDEARTIANALVSEELAACVNIIDSIHSIYRWQGAVESAAESLMLIKTRAGLLPAIESRLRDLHSYDVPELIAVLPGLAPRFHPRTPQRSLTPCKPPDEVLTRYNSGGACNGDSSDHACNRFSSRPHLRGIERSHDSSAG